MRPGTQTLNVAKEAVTYFQEQDDICIQDP